MYSYSRAWGISYPDNWTDKTIAWSIQGYSVWGNPENPLTSSQDKKTEEMDQSLSSPHSLPTLVITKIAQHGLWSPPFCFSLPALLLSFKHNSRERKWHMHEMCMWLTGISTLQSSPPILHAIWSAILVATVLRAWCRQRVRDTTHWLGVGQSTQRYFLTLSYLSFLLLGRTTTT